MDPGPPDPSAIANGAVSSSPNELSIAARSGSLMSVPSDPSIQARLADASRLAT